MKGFIYGQSEYNILASSNKLVEYVEKAKKENFDFLTITDPNLHGVYKFYKMCISSNIKPIIGIEYSYIDYNMTSKLLCYAKNNNGFKNLLKLSSYDRTKGDKSLEKALSYSDIEFIFVFNDSSLESALKASDFELIDTIFNTIKNNKAYLGISYTNDLRKINLITEIEKYAVKENVKVLPIHKCCYMNNEDLKVYEALTYIGGNKVEVSDFEDYSFLENPDEDERINNFVSNIKLDLFKDKVLLPHFPNNKGLSSEEYLVSLCKKGLVRRGKNNEKYQNRLMYELSVIHKMGYDDYFLIVWDFILYAKTHDILVGPGRGSAAGSLVAYCLGITEVDPIEYDLLFERFLNPERVTMPDIDTDFPTNKRELVIEHVKQVYGENHVCNISAFGTFQIKSSVRELEKYFNIDHDRSSKIIDLIEDKGFDVLLEEYKNTELYDFLFIAKRIEGLPKHISTHAAGIVLSSLPLTDIIPLQDGINGLFQSQLEAPDIEEIGLLKMDFLNVSNLDMIEDMMHDLNWTLKDLRAIPLNDKKVYEMLSNKDTLGIFQLESDGIRKTLGDLKPTEFSDIVATLALYRPGPMDNIPIFIKNKQSGNIKYIHKDLEPILKSTYGVIVYQEQIMQIAQKFAGYSLGEADLLRRAVSKKDSSKLDKLRNDFISRSIKNGYLENIAVEIYDLIYKFANYGFNKSHTVAYALLAYWMCYIKVNHFDVFMSSILNGVISSPISMKNYIIYAKKHGLKIKGPNINISEAKFVSNNGVLYIPFNAIFGVGIQATNEILKARNEKHFDSFNDFKERVNVSNPTIEALIYSGCFDSFGLTKKELISSSSKQDDIFFKYMDNVIKKNDEFDFNYLREKEKEYLGFNLNYSIILMLKNEYMKYNANSIGKLKEGFFGTTIGVVTHYKKIRTKKNTDMAILEISDDNLTLSVVIFPNRYQEINKLPKVGDIILVNGKVERNDKKELNLILDRFIFINN